MSAFDQKQTLVECVGMSVVPMADIGLLLLDPFVGAAEDCRCDRQTRRYSLCRVDFCAAAMARLRYLRACSCQRHFFGRGRFVAIVLPPNERKFLVHLMPPVVVDPGANRSFSRIPPDIAKAQPRAGSGIAAAIRRADGFGTLRISVAATTQSAPAAKNAGK